LGLTIVILNKWQKQSELLLNADDLDAMWVCLRENCVIDDATGAEKVGCFMYLYFRPAICQFLI
jgi:hypothetical protein